MKTQELILALERGLTLSHVVGLNDADLERLEKACYHWQQVAFAESCRREGDRRAQAEVSLSLGMGMGKSEAAPAREGGYV
jgi:hypothetical protein